MKRAGASVLLAVAMVVVSRQRRGGRSLRRRHSFPAPFFVGGGAGAQVRLADNLHAVLALGYQVAPDGRDVNIDGNAGFAGGVLRRPRRRSGAVRLRACAI